MIILCIWCSLKAAVGLCSTSVLSLQHSFCQKLTPSLHQYITGTLLQVESVEGNRANVVTSDGGRVIVSLKQTAVDTQFVEFEGTVEAPNQLRETDRAYFGGNFGKWLAITILQKFSACPFLSSSSLNLGATTSYVPLSSRALKLKLTSTVRVQISVPTTTSAGCPTPTMPASLPEARHCQLHEVWHCLAFKSSVELLSPNHEGP